MFKDIFLHKRRSRRIKRLFLAFFIPWAFNLPLICGLWRKQEGIPPLLKGIALGAGIFLTWSIWLFYNILPKKKEEYASWRTAIMEGGRLLCASALYGFALWGIFLIFLYPRLEGAAGTAVLWLNGGYGFLLLFCLLWNGILRMFFTSFRLRLKYRLLMLCVMWIPFINLAVLLWSMRIVHGEYDFACYKASVHQVRAQSDLCKTRYPLLLVHGVGFRDLRYFNYWGRIPRELARYGAKVYYGNQEAFGVISRNGEDIYNKIQQICRENNCRKVNIIAHSKGGLDARFAVSRLGAAPFVASLTTINTPHHGCRFVDYACRLPEGLYRWVARAFDWWFGRMGDEHPDFYGATRQFCTSLSSRFNEETPDDPGVYYQSYASVMGDFLSDLLLSVPYLLIRAVEGRSDGLVTPESAMWGEFRGTIKNTAHRGISHGDMIDLKREDYKGFDVVEFYVKLVEELKEKGF